MVETKTSKKEKDSILKDFSTYENWFNSNLYISQWDSNQNLAEETFYKLKDNTINLEKLVNFDNAISSLDDISGTLANKLANCIPYWNLEEATELINAVENHLMQVLGGDYSDPAVLGFDFEEYKEEEGWANTDYYESVACPTPDTVYKDALHWYPKLPETKEGEYIRLDVYEDGFDTMTERELLDEAIDTYSKEILQTLTPQKEEEKQKSKNVISC